MILHPTFLLAVVIVTTGSNQSVGKKKHTENMNQLEELIFEYFDDGFWYKEILEFLEFFPGYSLSLSSLRRILKRNSKKRRAFSYSQQELSKVHKGNLMVVPISLVTVACIVSGFPKVSDVVEKMGKK